ncbi:MAG: hypothetical protein ACFFFK_13110 [Candidatus Thorarchaeota archaeon]
MRVKRMKTLALLVGTCMVLTLCMSGFVTTADAVSVFEETGFITQDGWIEHYFSDLAGPEVMIELSWVDPTDEGSYDLDFYDLTWTVAGASLNNPEVAFLSGISAPTTVGVGIYGYYAGEGVEYTLRVTVGSDVIPDPYAEQGGLSVGAITSWIDSSRMGTRYADVRAAHGFIKMSNCFDQIIMPWYGWIGNPYEGSGWAGATFYAGDALLVGGLTWGYPMSDFTLDDVKADIEANPPQYLVDGIPLEDLGTVHDGPIRKDHDFGVWYYRLPRVIFKPGELNEILDKPPDYLHNLEFRVGGITQFVGYFYLL